MAPRLERCRVVDRLRVSSIAAWRAPAVGGGKSPAAAEPGHRQSATRAAFAAFLDTDLRQPVAPRRTAAKAVPRAAAMISRKPTFPARFAV